MTFQYVDLGLEVSPCIYIEKGATLFENSHVYSYIYMSIHVARYSCSLHVVGFPFVSLLLD